MKGRYHSSLYTRSSTANVRRFHRSHNLCTCSSLAGVCRCQRRRSANTPSPAAVALPQSVHLFIRRWCDATQPATQPTPTTVCACGLPLMVRIEGRALAGFSVAEDCGTRAAAWPNELALLFTTRSVILLHFSHFSSDPSPSTHFCSILLLQAQQRACLSCHPISYYPAYPSAVST